MLDELKEKRDTKQPSWDQALQNVSQNFGRHFCTLRTVDNKARCFLLFSILFLFSVSLL